MKSQSTAAAVLAALALTACGGGGGGGSATSTAPPPSTATANVEHAPAYTTGTSHASYRLGATDSFYRADCTGAACYRNINTGALLDVRQATATVYPGGVTFLHRRIEGPRDGDPSIRVPQPPQDVRQAWRDGWTGQGVNLLIVDEFGTPGRFISSGDERDAHGYTVALSAAEIAPRASFYALESGIGSLRYGTGGVFDARRRSASSSTIYHVVNHSFGNIEPSPTGGAPTQAEVNAEVAYASFRDLLGGRYRTADAVITFAAGNNGLDTGRFADAVALATHQSTSPRVLIVGALDGYARTTDPQSQTNVRTRARIASYSNRAGRNAEIQRRFLVEYGGTPYGESAFLCDASVPASSGCGNLQLLDRGFAARGTSFAAPRVAGFAALVRDKFPNLSGAHTANILLETATTMGLACHTGTARKSPSCSRSIYGQGRVDIGAALAPVGSLR